MIRGFYTGAGLAQRPNRRLAMITQQLLRLIQQLALVLRTGGRITPSQLYQNLGPCRLTHCFIHSGHGNPTSGATYPSDPLFTPSRVTKLLAQFAAGQTPGGAFIPLIFPGGKQRFAGGNTDESRRER